MCDVWCVMTIHAWSSITQHRKIRYILWVIKGGQAWCVVSIHTHTWSSIAQHRETVTASSPQWHYTHSIYRSACAHAPTTVVVFSTGNHSNIKATWKQHKNNIKAIQKQHKQTQKQCKQTQLKVQFKVQQKWRKENWKSTGRNMKDESTNG